MNANGNDPIERENDDIDQKGENSRSEFLVLMRGIALEKQNQKDVCMYVIYNIYSVEYTLCIILYIIIYSYIL